MDTHILKKRIINGVAYLHLPKDLMKYYDLEDKKHLKIKIDEDEKKVISHVDE